ncbi:MAG TPA: response regulator transcription factor [Nitrospirota bacterium]
MIKLLVADDHAIVRKGIGQIISETADITVADEAQDGQEVLEKAGKNQYDMVLLDISMPGRDGLDILKELKNLHPKLSVLMLSMYPEEQYAVRALRSGASGYLTKESAPDELIAAIRKVFAGGKYVSAALAEKLADNLTGRQADPAAQSRPLHELLSDRELQIMCMISSGKALTNIADELSLSVKTISTYRNRVLKKMRMKSNAEIIRYCIENKIM